jgi:hypothetical protein
VSVFRVIAKQHVMLRRRLVTQRVARTLDPKVITGVFAAGAVLAMAPAARADVPLQTTALYGSAALAARSLPAERDPRPGPAILYEPLARAPQLENAPGGIWHADPILVSGASAYRDGELLYQDFLYDDAGSGSYTYPTGPEYASKDLADLVEVRLKLTGSGTAFRITYNSMSDPGLVATTIGLGSSATSEPLPFGANASEPAQAFVTVHGNRAEVTDAVTGKALPVVVAVSVDTFRRQVQVIVPFSAFDPRGQRAVRVSAAAGLWDEAAGRYLVPNTSLTNPPSGAATATQPGGGQGTSPTAIFNAAFRYGEYAAPVSQQLAAWRNTEQSNSLGNGDLSPFYATVDFTKLQAGVTDNMWNQPNGTPATGSMDRILASHFATGQGRGDPAPPSTETSPPPGCESPCQWQYPGQLQPYSVYIPQKLTDPRGYAFTLDLHGCNNPYFTSSQGARQSQLASRGGGSIVVQGEARGACYWYFGEAGADPFEIWADVAHRYRLDPDRAAITGISMGGYGSFKLASTYPDLFSTAAPVVPCPSAGVMWFPGSAAPGGESSAIIHIIPSLRDVPVLSWMTANDEECVHEGAEQQTGIFDTLDALGYRYQAETTAGPEHDAFAVYAVENSEGIADFLGAGTVDRNPAHVTYVVNPRMNEPEYGLDSGHAYWLSDLTLRDTAGSLPLGRVDVFSRGFGTQDPMPQPTQHGAGVFTSGDSGSIPIPGLAYTSQSRAWNPMQPTAIQDRLDITASNLATITINATRARVDCDPTIQLDSDGPVTIRLVHCGTTRRASVTLRCPGGSYTLTGSDQPCNATRRGTPSTTTGPYSCSQPAAGLSGRYLGPVSLGMTRAQARRQFTRVSLRGRRFMDFFCTGDHGIRVGYPSPRLLRSVSANLRRRLRGRVVLILTSSRHYAVHGVRPGARLAKIAHRLRVSRPYRVGLNTWYLTTHGAVRGILKVRHGVIEEVGIADAVFASNRRETATFFRSFS